MITQADSGLNPTDYANLIAAFGDPVARVTLEQYSLSLVDQAGGGAGAANTSFDAIVVDDAIVRVWTTANTITVETLASEDAGDESWASQNLTATSVVAAAGLTLASSGDTVRVFWWDGTNIRYFESTDKGASWGGSTAVYAKSNVHMLAATALTTLHIISETTDTNYRFHVATYSGSWSETDSDIYWPFVPGSFDAITTGSLDDGAAASPDILVFSTDFPPMIKVGVENTEITRDYERVRGIAVIRYQNGRWSDHYHLDVVDNLYAASEREYVRVSSYDNWLFLTYQRIDGDLDYSHDSIVVSRSRTGIHWEQPYFLGALSDHPAMLVKRGAHAYVVSAEDTFRSPSVGFTGDSRVTQDVTDRVVSLTSRLGDIKEIQIALANGDGVLDNTSPLGDDVVIQAIIREGWVVGGTNLLIQTAVVDVDNVSQSLTFPTDHKVLTGRDVLGRLLTANADYVQEWPTQQISGDSYEGVSTSKYSGMHHTAALAGHWETGSNTLKLSSNKSPGVALHTGVSNAWNGAARARIYTSTSDSADYAGIAFRAYDQSNMWYVAYDADADKIKLVERRTNIDTLKAQTSAMGWDHETFYGLSVFFRYNQIRVYSSTDFVTYLQQLTFQAQGVSVPGAAWGDIPVMSGSMGYLGFGYSEQGSGGYPPLPGYIPWPSDPIFVPSVPSDWPTEVYVGTWDMGIYYTDDFTGADQPASQPTWTPVNAGLPSTIVGPDTEYHVRQLLLDPHNPSDRQYCHMGDTSPIYGSVYRRENGGTWTEILTEATGNALAGIGNGKIHWIAVNQNPSVTYDGRLYALFGDELDGGDPGDIWVLISDDYGSTWSISTEVPPVGSIIVGNIGNMVAYGDHLYVSWNRAVGGGTGRVSHSADEGVTWPDLTNSLGSSYWEPQLSLPVSDFTSIYVNSNSDVIGEFDLAIWNSAGATFVTLQGSLNIGPMRTDAMWHSVDNADHQRILKDNKLYVTLDSWTSVEDSTPSTIDDTNVGALRAPSETDETLIILGRTTGITGGNPQHVLVMDDESETSPIGKSGIDPANALTTVSIPETGDGICYEGLQPVVEP